MKSDLVAKFIAIISAISGILFIIFGLLEKGYIPKINLDDGYAVIAIGLTYILTGVLSGFYSKELAALIRRISKTRRVALFFNPVSSYHYVENLRKELDKKGLSVWTDFDEVIVGDEVFETIDRNVSNSDAAIFILDKDKPAYFDLFIGYALSSKVRIIPVLIGEADLPEQLPMLRPLHSNGDALKDANEISKALTKAEKRKY